MKCPWCDQDSSPRELHAHLGSVHADEVVVEDRGSTRVYSITCPTCGATHEQPIKPRLRDSGFLEEFGNEIRLVAFDMLINHMLAEHSPGSQPETEVDLPQISTRGEVHE
ncbi:MAG: hypothetical protein ACC660_07750 [Acidimicrobiales bacterium]